MKTLHTLLSILLLISVHVTMGQDQPIRFEHIGTEQGLSQSNVICILQDSRGFMWFGTREGLNKYDGYTFTVYKNDPANPHSISNNFIRDIIETKDGDLWIATLGGLSHYDRHKDRFTSFKHDPRNRRSISSNVVASLLEDSKGNLWVGTEDGLNEFDRSTKLFTHFNYRTSDKSSIGDGYIRSVFEDSKGCLWIGTYNGGLNLFHEKTGTFTRYQYDSGNNSSLSHNNVYAIFEDSKQRLWIGTNGGGLNLFNRANNEFIHYKYDEFNENSISGNSVYAINEDAQQQLWIGTENGGLSLLDPETGVFHNYRNDEADNTSLSNNSVYAIHRDRKGNMWLGTFNGGINLVDPDRRKFTHYKHVVLKNSLSNNNVLCIYEDSQRNVWIGTDGGGLNLFDPRTGRFTHFIHEKNNRNSICGNYVLTVCEDSKGNLWIGTWGDGVTVFNKANKTFKHFKNDPANTASLSSNNAWKIFEDREKNIWIGTYGGGLNLFDPAKQSFTRYQHDEKKRNGISSNNIYSIAEDTRGQLWISTDGGGLNLFDKKTKSFTHFLHDDSSNSIAGNTTGTIYQDKNDNLWIGTTTGLSFFSNKTKRFTNYTTADGLPNNVIFGILEDGDGNLWISTNKGISRFNPTTKRFKNFGMSDGLQSNEFKQQAYCKSYNGSMYFGGNNGFNLFSPSDITDHSFDPPLLVTGFQVFNKEVPVAGEGVESPLKENISEVKEITLPYASAVISFEFASLNYTVAEKKQYEYLLEGFDGKWNNIGSRRTATYTNLDPGKYVFKVRGLNNDGTWSTTITSLQLTILPPFWMTWWFRTLCIVLVIGCFVAFYRMRLRTVNRQKEKLEQLVKERTDEIVLQKETLSKNVEELAVLKEDLEKEKYYLDSLMDNMPDSIYFKDKESKLMRVSKYMAERFGLTMDELIGKSDFDFQDECHARKTYDDEQEIQQTRQPRIDYLEKEILKDGRELWVTTTKLPLLNARNEVVGTFGMSRDVTNIKRLEEERHSAELDKAVAQGKFEIASGVMHDIGNAVVGFGSYLTRVRRLQEAEQPANLQNLALFFEEHKSSISNAIGEAKADAIVKMLSGIAETQKSGQEELSKSINEQLGIISHIQEILNIQRQYVNGYESTERKPVSLKNIVNDSLSMLFAQIDKAGIQVAVNIPADLPLVKGDRTKLIQVVLNVLKNSMDAIDRKAEEKNIVIRAYTNTGKLVVEIKDNGRGFDDVVAGHLFKRGYTTKTAGSGLGLYNCQSIIESHDGAIHISSAGIDKGALAKLEFKV